MKTAKHANVSQVAAGLWIGGDLDVRRPTLAAVQLAEIQALGITDIVDCRIEWSDEDWVGVTAPALGYHWLGVDDAGQHMPDDWFDHGTRIIRTRLDQGGNVLAHCHMGINRGPSMGFAALLTLGWEPIDALDRIRQRRPVAFASYAEDALDWWHRSTGASRAERAAGRLSIAQWRRANRLDVNAVIRRLRLEEGA